MNINLRTVALLFAFAMPPVVSVGCGPKKPPEPADGEVNPKQSFLNGVGLLQAQDGVDYKAAYAQFKAAADARPGFAKAHYNAGWTSEQLGNLSQAATHYRAAVEADPEYMDALYALGDVLSRNGKGQEAVQLYRDLVAKQPEDLKARNALMEALTVGDFYDDAIAEAKVILLSDAKNVGAYRNLSRLYFAKGEYKMSQLCAEKAKELAKGDSGIYNNIGVTLLVMDDEPAAIDEFKTAIKLSPNNLEANLNLGYVALNSGDYALAEKCFEAALSGTPGSLPGKLGMAVALRGSKEYDKAAKLYEEIIEADATNQKAYFNSATLYEKYIKDYKKAEKTLQKFINENNADGSIGPEHEVHARLARIKESQAIEEARKREEDRKKKEAAERKARQEASMKELATKVAALQATVDKYAGCEAFVMGIADEAGMVIEQANMVIQAEEVDMAADVLTFVEQIQPMVDEVIPMCGAGGDAPPPPPPAPPAAPPAEGAPAEGG